MKKVVKLTDPKKAILIFLFIILIVPFYESKRMLIWSTQRINQKKNVFNSILVSYVKEAEKAKAQLGLSPFFDREHHFWLHLKKSPIVYQENIVPPPPPNIKDGESKDGKVIKDTKERKGNTTNTSDNTINVSVESRKSTSSQKVNKSLRLKTSSQKDHKPLKLKNSYRVLIIGDSFMAIGGGVGNPLERNLLNYKNLDVYRSGKVSSGLSRPDYFNWFLKTQGLISQYSPNVAIVMFGSNDAQAITTSKGKVVVGYASVGTEKWNKEYSKRVLSLLDIFKKNNITVFWIGLPIMKKENFSKKIQNLNSIYEKEIEKYDNAYFVPIWDLLTDKKGNYTAYLPDKNWKMRLARMSDGVHLQYFAGKLVSEKVISKMKEVLNLSHK